MAAIVLTSLGFTYAIALEATFGPDVLEILGGPLDYVAMSSWLVITAFNKLANVVQGPKGTVQLIHSAMAVAGFAFFAIALALALDANKAAVTKRVRALAVSSRKTWPWLAARPLLRRPAAVVGTALLTARRPTAVVGTALSVGFLVLLIARALLLVFGLALVPFFIGYGLAKENLHLTVIDPIQCRPSMSASARMAARAESQKAKEAGIDSASSHEPYLATCVRVASKEHGTLEGRRIVATRDAIALFNPKTGEVKVVPRKDSVVTFIDKL